MDLDERQWAQIDTETVEHLSRLTRLDTSNPPGNETPAALYLKQVLEQEGLTELQLLEAAPHRGNLIARLRGDGSQPPLLLSAPLDAAPAGSASCPQPPFSGAVWGGNARDMKQMAAICLMVLLLAKRQRAPLKRDLILAAVADAQMGMRYGSRWLVTNHPDLLRAQYGLIGLGGVMRPLWGVRAHPIQVAEKGLCRLRMRARAAKRLRRALERVCNARAMPVHVTPAASGFVRALAATQPLARAALLRGLLSPRLAPLILPRLPAEERALLGSQLTNTVAPADRRALQAGVMPSETEAEIHCRLLPGQTVVDVLRELRRLAGPEVEIEPLQVEPGVAFDSSAPLYHLLGETLRAHDPGAVPLPVVLPGSTDAGQYARLGITVYGFTPVQWPSHSHPERIPEAALHFGVRVLWDVIRQI